MACIEIKTSKGPMASMGISDPDGNGGKLKKEGNERKSQRRVQECCGVAR
jgi:hypothetical protein